MTAMIEANPRTHVAPRTHVVAVAGVSLPAHKLYAVAAAVLVGLLALVLTGSVEVVAWSAAVTAVAVGTLSWVFGDQLAALSKDS